MFGSRVSLAKHWRSLTIETLPGATATHILSFAMPTLTRQGLYDLVWSMPMTRLAESLGLYNTTSQLPREVTSRASAVRVIANILGVELDRLEVAVEGDVDVRGAMGIDKQVPVGFQAMRCCVRLGVKEGTDPQLLKKLQVLAERCCVVQQTLRSGVPIQTTFDVSK